MQRNETRIQSLLEFDRQDEDCEQSDLVTLFHRWLALSCLLGVSEFGFVLVLVLRMEMMNGAVEIATETRLAVI